MIKKKPIMRIGIASKYVTYSGKYDVNWGKSGSAYNRQRKSFDSRKKAVTFKNKLVRKFKPKNKINYIYLAD